MKPKSTTSAATYLHYRTKADVQVSASMAADYSDQKMQKPGVNCVNAAAAIFTDFGWQTI
ncbi:hypothetical protein GCM10010946_08350 [Undibacterium squillarum]|uniref:Uncharacterized protein n=1 Tax=Undibacterium squillarum TaxID=1131567 RepID=A0ABQ2XVE5_9BURK|nr:hypothetical protein GCM10010946_08350 [Undibacterium squillarum]